MSFRLITDFLRLIMSNFDTNTIDLNYSHNQTDILGLG